MTRVRVEYAKAVVMALLVVLGVVIAVGAHTLDSLWMIVLFGALTGYFVVKARAFARLRDRQGCGR